jgi:uncharacterized RDD family membrane protein YckC
MNLHNTDATAAGLTRRLLAAVYDWLLVLAIMMVSSVPIVAVRDDAISPGNPYYQLALAGVATIFFAGFWSFSGQTLGMRAWRLRLVQTNGQPARFSQCVFRFLCAIVSVAAAGMGFWWMLLDANRLTWHDRWSGTKIQQLPKPRADINAPD